MAYQSSLKKDQFQQLTLGDTSIVEELVVNSHITRTKLIIDVEFIEDNLKQGGIYLALKKDTVLKKLIDILIK